MLNSLLATIETNQIVMYVIMGVLLIAIIAMMVWSSKRRKKQEEEAQNLIDAVKPGNKVKTIGGICGIVVEVDNEENTFVLETGTEQSGKCFIKFDRQAIYQTDAVIDKDGKSDKDAEENTEAEEVEVKEEAPAAVEENKTEEVKEKSQEEAPAAEEATVQAPAKKSKKKN